MGLLFFGVVLVLFLTFFLWFLGPVSSWRWIRQRTSTATRCFYCKSPQALPNIPHGSLKTFANLMKSCFCTIDLYDCVFSLRYLWWRYRLFSLHISEVSAFLCNVDCTYCIYCRPGPRFIFHKLCTIHDKVLYKAFIVFVSYFKYNLFPLQTKPNF